MILFYFVRPIAGLNCISDSRRHSRWSRSRYGRFRYGRCGRRLRLAALLTQEREDKNDSDEDDTKGDGPFEKFDEHIVPSGIVPLASTQLCVGRPLISEGALRRP